MRTRQVAAALAALIIAADVSVAAAGSPRKPIRSMTCRDFLLADDGAKPEIVYWAAAFRKDGKPERIVVDVDDTDRIVPVIVEACKQAPSESLWHMVRSQAGRLDPML
jgi:acid stress chaperone HdeA